MPLDTRLSSLITAIGTEFKSVRTRLANLENTPAPYTGGAWKINLSSSHVVNSATEYDLGNLTHSVPVNATTDRFVVSFTTDCYATGTTAGNLIARLFVDGVAQQEQHIVANNPNTPGSSPAVASGELATRAPQTSIWLVDGGFLSTGGKVFKIMVRGPGNTFTLGAPHTRLQIWKIL